VDSAHVFQARKKKYALQNKKRVRAVPQAMGWDWPVTPSAVRNFFVANLAKPSSYLIKVGAKKKKSLNS